MENAEYRNIELPGVGEVRARVGTSTLELAGAAKYWHDRYQGVLKGDAMAGARRVGFFGGVGFSGIVAIIATVVFHYIRSR